MGKLLTDKMVSQEEFDGVNELDKNQYTEKCELREKKISKEKVKRRLWKVTRKCEDNSFKKN